MSIHPLENHELQPISPPAQSHSTQNSAKQIHRHTFKPSPSPSRQEDGHEECNDTHERRVPLGHRLVKKEIGWWERNIARVVPVGDDVRDHFGESHLCLDSRLRDF